MLIPLLIRRARKSGMLPFQHNITRPNIKTMAPEPSRLKDPKYKSDTNVLTKNALPDKKGHTTLEDSLDNHSDSPSDGIEPRRRGENWRNRNSYNTGVVYSYG